jgi:hypothetical protein
MTQLRYRPQSARSRLSKPIAIAGAACAALALLGLSAWLVYQIPFVHDRLEWRVTELRARVFYSLNPPEEAIFTPQATVAAMVQSTMAAYTTSPPAAGAPSATTTPAPTPTAPSTPLPPSVRLTGVRYERQTWNNCGPANLSMALSFWGWQGSQRDTAEVLKPNPRDKNVMPYEMASYVEGHTGLRIVVRYGGTPDTLRRLLAAGFPVIIEKGFEGTSFDGWMGHYQVLTGYDEAQQVFVAQDSYVAPDVLVPYDIVESYWRNFNFVYLVAYPPEREAELLALLGRQADYTASVQDAAERAGREALTLTGRDQYFAWFNRGTSLMLLQDYAGAAAAYDAAFQLYPSIPGTQRPWRMLWYQTGPYFAYFYSGRYHDVINLATTTLNAMEEPILEESYYWRALAREALGDPDGAVADLRASLSYHPGFGPSLAALQRMGYAP